MCVVWEGILLGRSPHGLSLSTFWVDFVFVASILAPISCLGGIYYGGILCTPLRSVPWKSCPRILQGLEYWVLGGKSGDPSLPWPFVIVFSPRKHVLWSLLLTTRLMCLNFRMYCSIGIWMFGPLVWHRPLGLVQACFRRIPLC